MPKFNSRPIDTLESIAAAIVLYQQNGNQIVLDNAQTHNSTKQCLINHFDGKEIIEDLDINAANLVRKTIEHEIMMSTLGTRAIPEFTFKVHNMIHNPTVPLRHVSYIAWAPHLAACIDRKNTATETINKFQFTSKHFGKIRDLVQLDINIVEQRYIKHYDSYRCKAYTSRDDIVVFYTKKKFSGTISITAKIKAHHDENGTKVTALNYVKEVK
jgi:hypothetical protein